MLALHCYTAPLPPKLDSVRCGLQVPETLPEEVLKMMHAPPKSADPVINVADLPKADGFCFGVPTRFGGPAAQVRRRRVQRLL